MLKGAKLEKPTALGFTDYPYNGHHRCHFGRVESSVRPHALRPGELLPPKNLRHDHYAVASGARANADMTVGRLEHVSLVGALS